MDSANRIIGSLGVAFSFLCAGATLLLSISILAAPDTSSSDTAGFGADVRVLLLYPVVAIAVVAAALSFDGGSKRATLGVGALGATLLCVAVLMLAH
jgi:hypothetical protein